MTRNCFLIHVVRAYRDEIAKLSTKSKPVLPYISVHLRDILFIELGMLKRFWKKDWLLIRKSSIWRRHQLRESFVVWQRSVEIVLFSALPVFFCRRSRGEEIQKDFFFFFLIKFRLPAILRRLISWRKSNCTLDRSNIVLLETWRRRQRRKFLAGTKVLDQCEGCCPCLREEQNARMTSWTRLWIRSLPSVRKISNPRKTALNLSFLTTTAKRLNRNCRMPMFLLLLPFRL